MTLTLQTTARTGSSFVRVFCERNPRKELFDRAFKGALHLTDLNRNLRITAFFLIGISRAIWIKKISLTDLCSRRIECSIAQTFEFNLGKRLTLSVEVLRTDAEVKF